MCYDFAPLGYCAEDVQARKIDKNDLAVVAKSFKICMKSPRRKRSDACYPTSRRNLENENANVAKTFTNHLILPQKNICIVNENSDLS